MTSPPSRSLVLPIFLSLPPPGQTGGSPRPRGGSPWEAAREWGLVRKRSGEVSQRELSADGFVISHKTGAFRFVNQSRLSPSINVRFIGSKKALGARLALGACLFEHGHSQDPKSVGILTEPAPHAFLSVCCSCPEKECLRLRDRRPPLPQLVIPSLLLAHIFLLDFRRELSWGDHFNGFVVRTLQRVARAGDPRPKQAEFNTSLCFVSRQSKPTTPLQSLSLAWACRRPTSAPGARF